MHADFRPGTLSARISSEDPVPAKPPSDPNYLSWDVDGLSDTTRASSFPGLSDAFSSATLVDVASRKRYLVAVDSEAGCLCTTDLHSNYQIGPGQSLTLDATYPAPRRRPRKWTWTSPGSGASPMSRSADTALLTTALAACLLAVTAGTAAADATPGPAPAPTPIAPTRGTRPSSGWTPRSATSS